jgi:hypothetical protein
MQTIAPLLSNSAIRSHHLTLVLQGIPSAWHQITWALWQVTFIMQSMAITWHRVVLTLQGIAFALHHPPFFPHQKILTKKSIDTLVQRDRLVYAIAMLVLSRERNG